MATTLQEKAYICELNKRVAELEEGGGGGGGGGITLEGNNTFTGANIFTQQVKFADGTAAAPGIAFASAPNTGIYISGGQMAFTHNGVLKAYFSNGGTFALSNTPVTMDVNGALNFPSFLMSGHPVTGGTATTTKPMMLLEPSGTTSTGWNTSGTLLGVNAASGFAGNLFDAQLNGASKFAIDVSSAPNYITIHLDRFNSSAYPSIFAGGTQFLSFPGGSGYGPQPLIVNASMGIALVQNEAKIGFGVSVDAYIGRINPGNLRQGNAPSATPLAQTLTIGEASRPGTDSNIAGANGTIQSGLGTGTGTASQLIFQTPTTVGAGSGVQTYGTRLTLASGVATFVGAVHSSEDFRAGPGNYFYWNGRCIMISPATDVITLLDNTGSSFGRLQLGGTTASFPAIRRTGAGIDIVTADSSAFAAIRASTVAADSGITVGAGTLVAKILSASASVNFDSMATGTENTKTITVTGAAVANNPSVELGWAASLEAGISVEQAWVSAANTVSIRVRNVTAGTIDPAAVTVRATVISF